MSTTPWMTEDEKRIADLQRELQTEKANNAALRRKLRRAKELSREEARDLTRPFGPLPEDDGQGEEWSRRAADVFNTLAVRVGADDASVVGLINGLVDRLEALERAESVNAKIEERLDCVETKVSNDRMQFDELLEKTARLSEAALDLKKKQDADLRSIRDLAGQVAGLSEDVLDLKKWRQDTRKAILDLAGQVSRLEQIENKRVEAAALAIGEKFADFTGVKADDVAKVLTYDGPDFEKAKVPVGTEWRGEFDEHEGEAKLFFPDYWCALDEEECEVSLSLTSEDALLLGKMLVAKLSYIEGDE